MSLPLGEPRECVQKSQLCQNHFWACILPLRPWGKGKEHLTQDLLSQGTGTCPLPSQVPSCSKLHKLTTAVASHNLSRGCSWEILEYRNYGPFYPRVCSKFSIPKGKRKEISLY